VVEHLAEEQKKAETVAKEEDIKSNMKMTEGKNEISVRYILVIADGPRHIHSVL
jgi:hypothetical protein